MYPKNNKSIYKNFKSFIIKIKILLVFIVFSISNLSAQTIRINEVVSSNSVHVDEDGDTPDWLELHNYGTESVSLDNWSLTDDVDDLVQWTFPNITLAPDQYLLIWASSKDRTALINNLHTNFKISSGGETLILTDNSGTVVDQITVENLRPDTSYGVSINSGNLVVYLETTPGNENSSTEYLGAIQSEVIFSNEGGLVNGPISLTLSGNNDGEEIRYTIGGDMPTETAALYTGPIQINASISVKAQIFSENYIPSEVYTKSYIINANHEIDVMLLTVEPADFFDEETGIYVFGPEDYETDFPYRGANFWEDWERPIHFAFYEKEGNTSVEFNAGVKIHGGASRGNEQKSLSLFARSQYGDSEFEHSFFDEVNYNEFQGLLLRNSGNDWLKSSMKDIMSTSLMRGSDLDFQEHTPVATYLNGEYWGLYNLREKVNEHMLASKHNVDADDITILEFNGREVEGSNAEYLQLRSYIRNTDLSIDSNFEFVAEEIDLESYALYQASQIYFNNTDWPGNNIKYWKHPEGKWRWIMFDTDFGFRDNWSNNTLEWALAENGTGANKEWATLFFRKLVTNIGFRNLFINRYADELNTRFLPSRVNAHIDQVHSTIEPEIINHYQQRWGVDTGRVIFYLNEMKTFANNRPAVAKDHLKSKFNLPAYHPITITNPELSQGSVEVNSNLNIEEAFWNGDYFETVPIQLKAMPKPGFEFSHWSGDISSTEQTISLTLVGQIEVTPNFSPTNSNDPIVINEINYKSSDTFDADDWVELYNPNETSIDLSNWELKDDDDLNSFIIPAGTIIEADGYIVIVKTAADFAAVYPGITNIIGDIDFGFGGSDAVRLFNANGSLEDVVDYQSVAPWSDCADETGNTLELISPDLNNALPESWSCINTNGSPNAQNSSSIPSAIVINEINYKSSDDFDADDWVELYNPNETSIDLSNWELKDDDDLNSFIIPAGTTIEADGYLVIVKTAADFNSVYPEITNIIGDIDFGFGGSDAVRLFNANGSLEDVVDYQSVAPWSDCADKTGNSLELISADLDNALPESWTCINTNGSPNATNSVPVIETCPSSQIVLSTQQEVDAFSSIYDIANCTFDGGIKVEGAAITNVNGLSGLTIVNGSFDISDSPTLTDLSGLSALSIVGGDLQIYNNATLENLTNLSALTSVGGNMFVSRNDVLTDLSGLSALTTIGGGLNISRNTVLSNCDIAFICDATVVADGISIYQNTGNCIDLATAEAACTFVPLICPSDEVVLTTQQEVDDFSSIYDVANCTFEEGISIEGADITNLNGLSGLNVVNGKLDISNNPILTDISGLSSVNTVGGNLSISTNASLANLNGLALLTTVGGNMLINKNAVLSDLSGLAQLISAQGNLNLSKNPVLSNCAIALICDVGVVAGDSDIYSNAGDCLDLAIAEAACSQEPEVDAGENQIIVLTNTSSAIFNGSANDPDGGTIVSFEWTQADGPNIAILSGENTVNLEVTGLVEGSYIFRLTVTDDEGETGFDEVVLEVLSGGFTLPVVNAGQDQISTESNITLNGSGSDPDGGDVVFLWTQESGPNTADLSGIDTAELIASNLIVGEYLFKLTVTDDENESTFDEVTVSITNPVLTCPTSQVLLTTQLEVDAFSSTYDVTNCTFDEGISIEGADITNLNGLSGLTIVNGKLDISNNPILTDISGLSSLSTIGGNLTISTNASLENLNGLALLTSVAGNMLINKNPVLTDLIGLAQLTNVDRGVNISKNPELSNCAIALICDATVVVGDTSLFQNAGNCLDLVTAEANCLAVPPTITCPEPITVVNELGVCEASFPIVPATATDDVSASENITIGFIRSDGELLTLTDPFPVGETTITWTATDEAGNVSESCDQLITVTDDEAPLAVAQDFILELDENGLATLNPTDLDSVITPSSDNCTDMVNLVYNASRTAFSCADIGTSATVSFSVTDAAGNESLPVSAEVTVVDVTAPELTCSSNIVENSSSGQPLTLEIVPPAVTDNCDSTPTISGLATFPDDSTLVLNDEVGQYNFPVGTTRIVWTAQDSNTQNTCTQTVLVNYTPSMGSSITSFSVAGVIGTINGTNITAVVPIGTNLETLIPEISISEFADVTPDLGTVIDFSQGAVNYTVTAQDNSSQTIYSVLVELESDVVAPVISLVGSNPQIIEIGAGYIELGATTDDGSPVTIDASEFVDAVGTYTIYYDATDGINEAIQVTRTVNVVDSVLPTLVSTNPADNDINVALNVQLVATFSEPVQWASGGSIIIRDLTENTVFATLVEASGAINFTGNTLIIETLPLLESGREYEVQISGTALEDEAGNPFEGIASGGWTFISEISQTSDSIWLEAECANVGNDWTVISDVTTSNGEYLVTPNGNNYTSAPTDSDKYVTFDFQAEGGTYSVHALAQANTNADDSFWVRANGGSWIRWNRITISSDFVWDQVHDSDNEAQPVNFELLPGANTLDFALREDGVLLDKIYVTNGTELPNGLGGVAENCIVVPEPPIVEAGVDQDIILPINNVVLTGNASDPDGGAIVSYEWTQETGPSDATLSGSTTTQLTATNLEEGTYVFRLTVTDDEADSAFDEVSVTVGVETTADSIWLEAECSNVGNDWTVISDVTASNGEYLVTPNGNSYTSAPTNVDQYVTFDFQAEGGTYSVYALAQAGTGADDSFWVRANGGSWIRWNRITRSSVFVWDQVHDSDNEAQPVNFELLPGANTLDFALREDGVLLDKIYVTNGTEVPTGLGGVAVNCIVVPEPPIVDAGADQDIILPINSVVLTGSANDPDGGAIANYVWTRESGPSGVTLNGLDTAELTATNLEEGVYVFRLTVTDDEGDTGFDEVSVKVDVETTADSIWLEAECANVGNDWTVISDVTASNGEYLVTPNGNNYTSAPTDSDKYVTFDFQAEGGTYSVHALAQASTNADDSFWVRANGGSWIRWNRITISSDFVWDQVHDSDNEAQPVNFELLPGANTLDFALREDGVLLDKIYVTNGTELPTGLGGVAVNCSSDENVFARTFSEPNQMKLSPNPAREMTVLSFEEPAEIRIIYVYDVLGRLIRTISAEEIQLEENYSMDVRGLPSGTYFIRTYDDNGIPFQRQMLIER